VGCVCVCVCVCVWLYCSQLEQWRPAVYWQSALSLKASSQSLHQRSAAKWSAVRPHFQLRRPYVTRSRQHNFVTLGYTTGPGAASPPSIHFYTVGITLKILPSTTKRPENEQRSKGRKGIEGQKEGNAPITSHTSSAATMDWTSQFKVKRSNAAFKHSPGWENCRQHQRFT